MMAINLERVEQDIQRVEQGIQRVEQAIQRVEQDIQDVEARLEAAAREDVASLREREKQLREESIRADKSDADVDRSEDWIKHMLHEQPPELPQNPIDLEKVLFPEKHGKLHVQQLTYRRFRILQPRQTEEFLLQADASDLPSKLSEVLLETVGPVVSEMDVSIDLGFLLPGLSGLFNRYSSTTFLHSPVQ